MPPRVRARHAHLPKPRRMPTEDHDGNEIARTFLLTGREHVESPLPGEAAKRRLRYWTGDADPAIAVLDGVILNDRRKHRPLPNLGQVSQRVLRPPLHSWHGSRHSS